MSTPTYAFPSTADEAALWRPVVYRRALSTKVLVVARTRIEGAWCAYVDAVPGRNHGNETDQVLDFGAKVDEGIARQLFPMFQGVRYAE